MSKIIYLEITKNCNQNCVFCIRPSIRDSKSDIKLDKIKKTLNKLKKDNVEQIHLTGGEPTLHKDIFSILKLTKDFKRVILQTNGLTLSNKKYLKSLIKNGLKEVCISFHTHLDKLSDETRGTKNNSHLTKRAIDNCLSMGIKVGLVSVIYRDNCKQLPGFVNFIINNYPTINNLNISLVVPEGKVKNNLNLLPRYEVLKPYLQKALDKCKNVSFNVDVSSVIPLCLIKGYEEYAASVILNLAGHKILDDNFNSNEIKETNFSKLSNPQIVKAPQCKSCFLNSLCPGFYSEYSQNYGYSEFTPLKIKSQELIKKIKQRKFN